MAAVAVTVKHLHKKFCILLQCFPLWKQVWQSKPTKTKVSQQTLDKQTERVQDEDMVMYKGQGKSCWMGDKHYSSNYLFSKVNNGPNQRLLRRL